MPARLLGVPDLTERTLRAELMDQDELAVKDHEAALRGLARLNWWSTAAGTIWRPIATFAKVHRRNSDKPLRLLDVATASGDLPTRLWHNARRSGLPLEVAGCDRSATAIDFARQKSAQTSADIDFYQRDVLAAPFPCGYDIVTCALFLHHLTTDEAEHLLRRVKEAGVRLLVISDLRRTFSGYALAFLASRTLTRSHVVHNDALLSVAAAFSIDELASVADVAGLSHAEVKACWPCRMLLTWSNSSQ